jgi:anti-sigma factor RsiW
LPVFETMNCQTLDTELTPYLDGELVEEARVAVEGHLSSCPICAKRVEVERHNLAVVRLAAQQGPRAPQALRESVFAAVRADAASARRRRMLKASSMAAGVAFAVLFANHQYRVHQFRLYEQDAALRHSRQFPLEMRQPGPEQIEAWFGGKLDHRVNVPRFPHATAAGARLLQVRDKQAAYIRYDSPRPMGLFVFGDDHDVEVGSEPMVGSSLGYNVVSWREGDVVYQLVTDLDEQDLRALVPGSHQVPSSPLDDGTPLRSTPPVEARPASLQR